MASSSGTGHDAAPDLPVAAPDPAEPYYDIEVKQWLIDYVPTEFRDAALADLDALLAERQQDKERIERLTEALAERATVADEIAAECDGHTLVQFHSGRASAFREIAAALAVEEDA